MISGSIKGTEENDEYNIDRKSIVDLLEAKGVSWKTYQEDYPGNCNKKMYIDKYARKHNPFMSFKNISTDKKRCAKIVNSKQLDKDIASNKVPQFVFYTPDVSLNKSFIYKENPNINILSRLTMMLMIQT